MSNTCLVMTGKVEPKARYRYVVSVGAMARQVEERKDQKISGKVRNSRGKRERWWVCWVI